MFVKGCVPHSGPSKNPPVTGMPCWFGYLAARKNSGLVETMPTAPLDRASCTAVAISVGLVWSSRTIPVDLVAVDPALGVLQGDAGIEAGRGLAELR